MYEDLNKTYKTFLLWKPSIQGELQSQNYEGLERQLKNFLGGEFDAEEWEEIYWSGILEGIPSIKGDIDEQTWRQYVLPAIGRAVIGAASTEALIITYASLEKQLKNFHDIIINSIQGSTPEQKTDWLKSNRPEILNFYKKNIIGLRVNLEEKTLLADEGYEKFRNLPKYLKMALLSPKTSEEIAKIAEKNHISQEKLTQVSNIVGLVILGHVRVEELAKKIEEKTHIDHRVAATLSKEIANEIIKPLRSNPEAFLPHDSTEKTDSPRQGTRDPSAGLLTPAFKKQERPAAEPTPAPVDSQEIIEPTSPQPPQPTIEPQTPPAPPTPSATSVPAFKRPNAPEENTPAVETPSEPLIQPQMPTDEPTPFILHEEEEIEPLASGRQAPLSRPHFFKSTAGESTKEKAVSARLEIGEEPQVEESPKVGRTEKEEARVVNYTNPELKVDPFKRPTEKTPDVPAQDKPTEPTPQARQTSSNETQEKVQEPTAEEPKEISPDNIVNLKDLPQ